jgi:integrase
VEVRGFEPLAFSLRTLRSTCAGRSNSGCATMENCESPRPLENGSPPGKSPLALSVQSQSVHVSRGTSLYEKVANVPCLYRHVETGNYYAVKKVKGRRKEHSLRTADRKIAERRLKEWTENLGRVDREVEKTTLRELLQKFAAVTRGKSDSTETANKAVTNVLCRTWPTPLDIEVRQLRPSHLEQWLASQERRIKNTTYNRYAGFLKQMFELAVKDRIIGRSPFDLVATRWKKPQRNRPQIPTVEQFERIVHTIRAQRFTDHAEDSADFIEFLGLAGLGQAEASALTWRDVEWPNERLCIRRQKTDVLFYVPIYPHLRPLLERLRKKADSDEHVGDSKVFRIKDPKKALRAACIKLGFPQFSQRNMRQCLIMRLWKSGVDKKLIAKWQGHRDGGKLIMDTYTEVFGDDEDSYERQQLAKLASRSDVQVPSLRSVENVGAPVMVSVAVPGV